MEQKTKFQYSYFIYPYVIAEEKYEKYLARMLKKPNCQLKVFEKEKDFGEKMLRELERVVILKIVDERWMDHIDSMDELKDGIGLRAYGQRDPVVQYRIEGFDMFEQMISDIQVNVVKILMNAIQMVMTT